MTPPDWSDRLRKLANGIVAGGELAGKWVLAGAGPRLHEIVPYVGYGNDRRVLVQGRAVEERDISASSPNDSYWRNLLNTYRRIERDPLRHARVRVRLGNDEHEIVADNEGFFRQWIEHRAPPVATGWEQGALRLLAPLRADQPDVHATFAVCRPSPNASFAVISDLDDTVIQSRIANFLQAVRTISLGNARTRLPFPGVAAFYRALARGGDGARDNPIFYVSSSPWNIYDVIVEFLELQHIPGGPICLRDWDISVDALAPGRLHRHKAPLITEILDTYPALPFILIGDTSQQDPEIYHEIARRYGRRILAVYIRNVNAHPERSAAIQALAEEVLAAGSSLLLADDSAAAARHAAEHGWITPESVREVERATSEDEDRPDAPESPTVVVE